MKRVQIFRTLFISICLIAAAPVFVVAQSEDAAALKKQARALIDVQNMNDALPLYERLAILTPDDPEVQLYLGFSLLGRAANTTEPELKKKLRLRARGAFIRSRDLGNDSVAVRGYIDGLPADGGDGAGYSDNAEANRLMQKGEGFFSSGKLDEARDAYEGALKLDPRCYYAALFIGDVWMQRGKYSDAESSYQRAIKIDPYKETAYRYSATPLMKQSKFDEARDRYVDAFITEPYNRLALSGIIQWGQATKTQLAHPKIDIPKITIGADGKSNANVTVDPTDDGSMAWMSYVTTRDVWRKERFAKTYPSETEYRHSLEEEADALRSVVTFAKELKPKSMNKQIEMVGKMDKDGVLEAFILLAIPDRGIAQDHAQFLRNNREKLRKYVLNYVIQK